MSHRNVRTTTSAAWAVLSLLLVAGSAQAETFEIDPAHSTVGFRIRHLVSTVGGSFSRFSGTIELNEKDWGKSKVNATIEAASINTNNERRDAHLRGADFFETDKYPTITFASTKVVPRGKGKLRVLGNLTMHGVTRPVILEVAYAGQMAAMGGKRAGFSATTSVNRKDFKITYNRALDRGGTMLGDDVAISIDVEAAAKK